MAKNSITATPTPRDISVVLFGSRGILLRVENDEENLPGHLRALTKVSAALQRTIFKARKDTAFGLDDEDLVEALAGVELISNMAVEVAQLIEVNRHG